MNDSEDFYRALFEQSADAILVIEDDRFVDCNPAAVRMLRFSDKESLLERYSGGGRDGTLRAHPGEFSPRTQPDGRDSFEKAEEIMAIAYARGTQTFEWDHVRADGDVFPVEVQLTPIQGFGRPRLLVQWRDIAERKQLEAEVQRGQRLEAVGRLAGGIAHDFNNLLLVILSYAELLHDRLAVGSDEASQVAEIEAAANRGAALSRQLLSFSRNQPIRPVPTDLVSLLRDSGAMLGRLIGEDVELSLALPDRPVVVRVDPSQIERMVVNLVTNARDAMPEGGRLRVHLEAIDEPDARVPGGGESEGPSGSVASITVSDSGVGMTPDQMSRAFEPFYSTKLPGAGTGLGLATVLAIAEQCGGRAFIDSTPQRGTTVNVAIPLCEEAPLGRGPAKTRAPASPGNERLLLVEDEEAIRRLMANALRDSGYQVLVAGDGVEALEVARAEPGPIDLVVSDVVMPHLSGPEFVERLRGSRPEVAVIFMSGYAHDGALADGSADAAAEIIEKPFAPTELVARVRRVLDCR